MKPPHHTKPSPAARAPAPPPPHEQIARIAYAIWEREGRPHGRAVEHWLQAMAQLARAASGDPSLRDGGNAAKPRARVRSPGKLGLVEIAPVGGKA